MNRELIVIKEYLKEQIPTLYPGAFAFVMATGVASLACNSLNMVPLAWAFLVLNVVVYVGLWIATLARLRQHSMLVVADLMDYTRGTGFFTTAAATSLLGLQILALVGSTAIAVVFWLLAVALCVVLGYAFLAAATVRAVKPILGSGMDGGWLLLVVAPQSIVILAAALSPQAGTWRQPLLFVALAFCLLGSSLYLLISGLLTYRLLFFSFRPEALTPQYWIVMGAAAITSMASAGLSAAGTEWPFLGGMLPLLNGMAIASWAVATFWIPLLVILGIWRHAIRHVPLVYDPSYWAVVFPLGMYTESTLRLGKTADLSFLLFIAEVTVYVTLLAWLAACGGMIWSFSKQFARKGTPDSP